MRRFVPQLFIYILLFMLLREWLKPVVQLTDTGFMQYILLFVALALTLRVFKVHWLLAAVVQLSYIAVFIFMVYTDNISILSIEAWHFFVAEWRINANAIFHLAFEQVSNVFRTLLLFILIWMLVYLVQQWVTMGYNIFYFFAMTVFFIATLDTFTAYDGEQSIIMVMFIGFLLIGAMFIKRLEAKTHDAFTLSYRLRLYMPFVMLVIGVIGIAIFLPKSGPSWADPVAFISGNDGVSETQRRVGYSEDDTRLGGSVEDDDTLVFTAKAESSQYWRIETKDTYTTKGWVQQVEEQTTVAYTSGEPIESSFEHSDDMKTVVINNAEVGQKAGFIVQPYATVSIDGARSTMTIDQGTEKITTDKPIASYQSSYSPMSFMYKDIPQTTDLALEVLPSEFDRYLQLPALLPQRITTLAQDITAHEESVLDKAQAIEDYFKHNQFIYDKKNVTLPAEDQDYVDQFLFETKRGYCDNFSTAMVVMLRSVGIPARWTKGFAPGYLNDAGQYEITNNEAHSWVEAYIPGIGWLPFEPTIGFDGVDTIDYTEEPSPNEVVEEPEVEPQQPKEQVQEPAAPKKPSVWSKISTWLQQNTWLYYVLVMAICLTVLAMVILRKQWLPGYYVRKFKNKARNRENFMTTYTVLVAQFARFGYDRHTGETLKQYAKRIDEAYATTKMQELTEIYEQLVYSESEQSANYEQLHESWEYLINRTTG